MLNGLNSPGVKNWLSGSELLDRSYTGNFLDRGSEICLSGAVPAVPWNGMNVMEAEAPERG